MGLGYDRSVIDRPEVRERFFESGRRHVERVMHEASLLGMPPKVDWALDFGCGVGRLVRALTDYCEHVVGVDISPEMLKLTRENCPDEDRVRLVETLEDAEVNRRKYDLVHTYLVLQHLRPSQGLPIIRKLVDLAAPGGIVAIHVPIADLRRTRRLLNLLRYRIPPIHWAYNLALGRRLNFPMSEMNVYPVHRVDELLAGRLGPRQVLTWERHQRRSMMIVGKRLPS